jgi:glycosyltransferase involved in cell wall biosynthesis
VRITIVLPFVNLTGGVRVMLDYANLLQAAGHQTTVVYPTWPYQFQWSRRQQWHEFQKTRRGPVHVPWFPLACRLLRVPFVRSRFMPDADVVIATAWPTAHDVARLPASKGRKILIVMHHESGSGPEARIVEVYRMPFYRIAFSQFVKRTTEAQFGCRVDDVVTNGVDTRLYYPDGNRQRRQVAMLYHPDPRKGGDDGLEALTRLYALEPDVAIRLCGTVRPDRPLPAGVSFEFHPPDAGVRRLLSESTVLLYPSRYEGFGLPPLEAMACGCPVVTTDVGAVPEFAVHRQNAIIVPAGDVDAMVGGLQEVLRDRALQQKLSAGGLATAAELSLERVGPWFVAAVERARSTSGRAG